MSSDQFFNPTNFAFEMKNYSEMSKMVQSVQIPGLNGGSIETQTPFKYIPHQSDHLSFDDLIVTFKINEDWSNYLEMYNWLIGINFPENWDQYADLKNADPLTGGGLRSDGTVILFSSANRPIYRIEYSDMFPTNLSGPELTTMDSSIEYLTSTVTFKFKYMKFTSS